MPSARPIPVIMLTMKTDRLNSRASSAAMPRPTMMESRAISAGIKPATTAPNTSSRITMEIGSPKSSSPCLRSLADRVVKSFPTVWSPVTATANPPLPFAAWTSFTTGFMSASVAACSAIRAA